MKLFIVCENSIIWPQSEHCVIEIILLHNCLFVTDTGGVVAELLALWHWSSFLQQFKDMLSTWTRDFKAPIGVDVSVFVC